MKEKSTKSQLHFFLGFLLCVLLYLFIGLLYSWKTPGWLVSIPHATGLRLLLVLEVYVLCCTAFFFWYSVSSITGKIVIFRKVFIVSFSPMVFFALLVMMGFRLHTLRSIAYLTDILVWLIVVILLYQIETINCLHVRLIRNVHIWLGFPIFYFLSGVFFFFPFLPAISLITLRLFVLALFSVLTFVLVPSRDTEVLRNAIKRYRISAREAEVLALLIEGNTNEEIADALYISLSTVKSHIASIFQKTGARNRLEVAYKCGKQENRTFG